MTKLLCTCTNAISISTVANREGDGVVLKAAPTPLLTCNAHALLIKEKRRTNYNRNETLVIHLLKLTLKKSSWCTTQQLGKVLINLSVRVVLPPLVTL